MTSVETPKSKKKKKRSLDEATATAAAAVPSLYQEDLGIDGVKKKRATVSFSMASIQSSMKLTKEDVIKLQERKSRFGNANSTISSNKVVTIKPTTTPDPLLQPLAASRHGKDTTLQSAITSYEPLVGTNMNIEKDFLRLTTYPKKEEVRPYEILLKSLAYVKTKYIQDEDFDYINNQLKSIRQDIVCQNLRNSFVLDVYETHARILLEHGDLNEFNQCQTMIRTLTEGTNNSTDDNSTFIPMNTKQSNNKNYTNLLKQTDECRKEFCSYAVLYAVVRNSRIELKRELDRMKEFLSTDGSSSSTTTTTTMSSSQQEHHHENCCDHAVQVIKAVEECNYYTFFRLYSCAPHMSAYLMDFLVKRVRDQAYERIIAAYRPSVSIEQIRESLYLDDLNEARRFLQQRNAVYMKVPGETPFYIDCKASK